MNVLCSAKRNNLGVLCLYSLIKWGLSCHQMFSEDCSDACQSLSYAISKAVPRDICIEMIL